MAAALGVPELIDQITRRYKRERGTPSWAGQCFPATV